jgi:4-hydroxy-2-oxoheptanedioate aldolase
MRSLKERLAEKKYVLNGYCTMPGTLSAEIYSRQGWDAVTIDMQHGAIGYDFALPILQAITASGVVPLVRVPWLEPGLIMKLLDAGALGITSPMINTAEDAERLVRYCKYPPRGERSTGPLRASMIYGADYIGRANAMVNVFAMIETAEAVENVEKITAVDGLDGIYIGPQDLSMSLGKGPRREELDPEVDAAVERILQQCIKRNLVAGIIAPTPDHALKLIKRGFRFITMSNDARALAAQAKSLVDGVHKLVAPAK